MKINYKNNQSLKFLLPLVTELPPQMLVTDYLLGVFVGDVDRPQWDGKILVAYHLPTTSDFAKLDASLCRLPNYVTSYDNADKRIVVYVLDIPDSYIQSVENVLDGRYSLIHPNGKLSISKFWFDVSGSNTVRNILSTDHTVIETVWEDWGKSRNEYCEEGEYWFKPILEEELFDIDEF